MREIKFKRNDSFFEKGKEWSWSYYIKVKEKFVYITTENKDGRIIPLKSTHKKNFVEYDGDIFVGHKKRILYYDFRNNFLKPMYGIFRGNRGIGKSFGGQYPIEDYDEIEMGFEAIVDIVDDVFIIKSFTGNTFLFKLNNFLFEPVTLKDKTFSAKGIIMFSKDEVYVSNEKVYSVNDGSFILAKINENFEIEVVNKKERKTMFEVYFSNAKNKFKFYMAFEFTERLDVARLLGN